METSIIQKKLQPKRRVFKLSPKCKYYENRFPEKYSVRLSKSTFFKRVKKRMKNDIIVEGIYIEVKHGRIVSLRYGQI